MATVYASATHTHRIIKYIQSPLPVNQQLLIPQWCDTEEYFDQSLPQLSLRQQMTINSAVCIELVRTFHIVNIKFCAALSNTSSYRPDVCEGHAHIFCQYIETFADKPVHQFKSSPVHLLLKKIVNFIDKTTCFLLQCRCKWCLQSQKGWITIQRCCFRSRLMWISPDLHNQVVTCQYPQCSMLVLRDRLLLCSRFRTFVGLVCTNKNCSHCPESMNYF